MPLILSAAKRQSKDARHGCSRRTARKEKPGAERRARQRLAALTAGLAELQRIVAAAVGRG